MARKYYKENRDADLEGISIRFKCPNTGISGSIQNPHKWDYSGYSDRLGETVSVKITCPMCKKHHTIDLRND